MNHITCRLTAKNRDQFRNPTLGNRVRATFTFFINVRSGKPKAVVWCLSVFLVFLAHPGCAKLWAFVLLLLLFFFFKRFLSAQLSQIRGPIVTKFAGLSEKFFETHCIDLR